MWEEQFPLLAILPLAINQDLHFAIRQFLWICIDEPNCLLALCPNSADSLQIPTELHLNYQLNGSPSGFASEVLAGLFPSS